MCYIVERHRRRRADATLLGEGRRVPKTAAKTKKAREKERKKPGLKRARKAPTYTKR